jgi:hypothetical protein
VPSSASELKVQKVENRPQNGPSLQVPQRPQVVQSQISQPFVGQSQNGQNAQSGQNPMGNASLNPLSFNPFISSQNYFPNAEIYAEYLRVQEQQIRIAKDHFRTEIRI